MAKVNVKHVSYKLTGPPLFSKAYHPAHSSKQRAQGAHKQRDPAVLHKIKGWWGLQAEPSLPRPTGSSTCPEQQAPNWFRQTLRCWTALCPGRAGRFWAPSQSSQRPSSSSQAGARLQERRNLNSAQICLHNGSRESQQVSLRPGNTGRWQRACGPPPWKPHWAAGGPGEAAEIPSHAEPQPSEHSLLGQQGQEKTGIGFFGCLGFLFILDTYKISTEEVLRIQKQLKVIRWSTQSFLHLPSRQTKPRSPFAAVQQECFCGQIKLPFCRWRAGLLTQ